MTGTWWLAGSLLAVLSPTPSAAQCTIDPGTGCPGHAAPLCIGTPRIGNTFSLDVRGSQWPTPYCNTGLLVMLAIGVPLPAPIVIGYPTTCLPWPPCVLGCSAIVVYPFLTPTFTLPQDPTLIGAQFCAQGACIEAGWCWGFTPSLRITIQR